MILAESMQRQAEGPYNSTDLYEVCRMKRSYYICGTNLHQQIATGSDAELFYSEPQRLDVQSDDAKFYVTWSQVWCIEDDKRITYFGFQRDKIQLSIDRMAEKDRINVVPVNNNTLIQTGGQTYMITEGGTLIEITVEGTQTDVLVLGSTGSEILGICGKEELHKSQVNILTASLTFSPFNPVFCKEVKQVSCGNDHTLILSTDGGVYTYGSNSRGQLGHGGISVDMVSTPQLVTTLEGINITGVAAGGWHSAVISDGGDLYMWGWNETGQLGLPCPNMDKQHNRHETQDDKQHRKSADTSQKSPDTPLEIHQQIEPVLIQTEPYGLDLQEELKVKNVVCGSRHTCVLFDSGVVMSSGFNAYGQLGLGDTDNCDYFKLVPFFIENKLKVVDIHGGSWNMVFVTENDVT